MHQLFNDDRNNKEAIEILRPDVIFDANGPQVFSSLKKEQPIRITDEAIEIDASVVRKGLRVLSGIAMVGAGTAVVFENVALGAVSTGVLASLGVVKLKQIIAERTANTYTVGR